MIEFTEDMYKNRKSIFGGRLSEIPKPHVRMFPNNFFKRKVTVTISRYYDYGTHYYGTIKEEDNPIWNAEKQGWHTAFDDVEAKGLTDTHLYLYFDEPLACLRENAYEIVRGKIKILLKKFFQNHEVVWEDYCKNFEKVGR